MPLPLSASAEDRALLHEWMADAQDRWAEACDVLDHETIAAHWSERAALGRRRWMGALLRRRGRLHIHQLVAIVLRVPQALLPGLAEPERILLPFFQTALDHLCVRPKLPEVNTLEHVLGLIAASKNIAVLTGAGVSVSCGIPDFRSRDGIYRRLHDEFGMAQPEDMFDIDYFRHNPQPFFSFVKELFPGNFKPSPSHYFIRLLEDKGKLLRNYTQNIDTLESVAGVTRAFQCHGSFKTATCQRCGHCVPGESIRIDVFADKIPYCPKCEAALAEKRAQEASKKRKTFDEDDNDGGGGGSDDDDDGPLHVLKPDIVFFGQDLPSEFDQLLLADRDKVDLLIVMGSSLQVAPVSGIMGFIPASVPQIVINREPIKHMEFDVELLGNCDGIVAQLCARLGWLPDLERLVGTSIAEPPEPEFVPASRYLFPGAVVTKPAEDVASDDDDGRDGEEGEGETSDSEGETSDSEEREGEGDEGQNYSGASNQW